MKSHFVENIPAVKRVSDFFIQHNIALPSTIKTDIESVLEGVEKLDKEVKQKEQLLVQKEKELERLKSITDNSSKVARDVISESKGNLDQAVSLHKSGKFGEALKYSDIALYNIGDINSFGVKTVEQANKLYVERLELYKEATAKRDYFYNQGVINGVNAFSWVKDNPTRDFYSFFRDTLKVSDKSPENVNLIQNRLYKNLPKYLEEAQRANSFYSEYNKYYDAMTKLQQVINIYNIKAASSKGLKDYEDALKSCEIALEIDPTSSTLVNLKNAVLKEKQAVEVKKVEEEKLLVSQSKEIEKLKEVLAHKEVETQEKNKLLTQKGNELASKEKVLIDQHKKETEGLKALLAKKELEHQELLARKELEKQKLIVQKEKEKEELLALKEKQAKELENTKKLQEENIKKEQLLSNQNKLLSDKEQRIEELKSLIEKSKIEKEELLTKQELAVANKSYMKNQIIDELREEVNLKENEVVDLKIQNLEKELITQQKEKLLIQKETEIQEKSFVKNQVINELQEDIGLKEREAYKLQIESLMKQLEFKDKALEDAREIAKQNKIINELKEKELADVLEIVKQKDVINELQGKLLDLKALYGHEVSFSEEFSAIQFQAENNIANNDFNAIQDLSRYISALLGSERENAESIEISKLIALNESPIVHVEENHVQQHVPVINNFGINNHTTHSVLLGGEGSESFDIIDLENSH